MSCFGGAAAAAERQGHVGVRGASPAKADDVTRGFSAMSPGRAATIRKAAGDSALVLGRCCIELTAGVCRKCAGRASNKNAEVLGVPGHAVATLAAAVCRRIPEETANLAVEASGVYGHTVAKLAADCCRSGEGTVDHTPEVSGVPGQGGVSLSSNIVCRTLVGEVSRKRYDEAWGVPGYGGVRLGGSVGRRAACAVAFASRDTKLEGDPGKVGIKVEVDGRKDAPARGRRFGDEWQGGLHPPWR
mmetsp:Transcript_30495/g.87409  ORF Transcript_30495/g.87409 Transcript_30495/m.87409 type:complete len:245 (+) Transcript_30495:151-885(+)